MRKLVLQDVAIQDVVNSIVRSVEEGSALTGTARAIGCLDSATGRTYSLSIVASCDEEEFGNDFSLPALDSDTHYSKGRCVIRAPENHFPSSLPLEAIA